MVRRKRVAKTVDLRTYIALERAFLRRLLRSWRIQSAPIYQKITQACLDHKWDEARRLVPDLDMTEVGTENREWITYMLLSCGVFGANMVAKGRPSFVGVGSFDTFLKQTTNNMLQYLELNATAQIQKEALQLIAEDEAQTKAVLKWDASKHPREPKGSAIGGQFTEGTVQEGPDFTRVAITSQRPEGDPGHQANKEVFQHMHEFQSRLEALPGVTRVSVKPGVGGWDGGSESMWQVFYRGNGAARRLVAQTAKTFNQDAVLVLKKCTGSNCQPAVELSFAGGVSPVVREKVHAVLVKNGIQGWTWMKRGGKTLLRMVSVPQWGGVAEKHQKATAAVSQKLREDGLENHRSVHKVAVSVMEREGDNSYDRIIGRTGT
jgi:hypothetical protein